MLSVLPLTATPSPFNPNKSTASKASLFAIQLALRLRITSHTAKDLSPDFFLIVFY